MHGTSNRAWPTKNTVSVMRCRFLATTKRDKEHTRPVVG